MTIRFQRLSRPMIRQLSSGQRITEHGITAERTKSGDVRFSVNVMIDGQRIHRVIGRESEGVTREQAERAIETFKTKAREERLDLPSARKTHKLFREAASEYLDRLTQTLVPGQKGFADLSNKRRNVEKYLVPYFGNHHLHKISSFTVKHYVRQRFDKGAKLASINRELATLSHLFTMAVSWKWMKADNRPAIEKEAEAQKQIDIMDAMQQQDLMRGAISDQDAQTWLFVAIGINTAMRHSEILRIRWEQINFATMKIYLPQAKAGQREQPMTKALAEMLVAERNQRDDQKGWIFPATRSHSKTPHRQSMEDQFARAVVRAGLDPTKVTPHTMRHTAITRLVQSGVDLPTIQRISGHKTLTALMRYVHLTGTHIDAAIANIDSPLPEAITPELHITLKQPLRAVR